MRGEYAGDREKISMTSFVKRVYQVGSIGYSFEVNRRRSSTAKQQAGLLLILFLVIASLPALSKTSETTSIERGEYIYRLSGCESCHADSAGGVDGPVGGIAMETPFGIFNIPNITPDTDTGIGGWTDKQFLEAMKTGVSPNGEHYYPAFPYTSYTRMYEQDLMDLKVYLDSLPPVNKAMKDHDLSFPFNQRWLMGLWKVLFFQSGSFKPDSTRTASWNRGAYIVNGPGHCVECHTPRNMLGALKTGELLAGNPVGFDGESVPGINPALNKPFSQWSEDNIVFSLQTGMLPNGDFFSGSMGHIVENSTSRLSEPDLKAIADYLRSPVIHESSGIFSSLFGTMDAVAREHNRMGHGHESILGGGFKLLFWLLSIAGLFWLTVPLIQSKRRMPRDKDAHEKSS